MAALKIALAKAARGGTIAAAAGGAALLAMACSSAVGATQALARTVARAAMPEGVVVTSVVDLVSPRLGLVGLGASASDTTSGQARLMLTTNFGRTFTSIGPKTAALTEPDSIFFLAAAGRSPVPGQQAGALDAVTQPAGRAARPLARQTAP